ncbi:MAG: hypothetical protein LBI20_03660 [Holosporales bacterium]|jgi:hypothetical protein|nr:hypothetical protein [Holosporales bacterium]
MQKVANALRGIFDSYSVTLTTNILLKKTWKSIVGDDLARVSSFIEAKFVGKGRVDVYCNILSAAAVIMRCHEQSIVERLKTLMTVQNIKIHFKHCGSLHDDETILSEFSSEFSSAFDSESDEGQTATQRDCAITTRFRNARLRAALALLAAAMQKAS